MLMSGVGGEAFREVRKNIHVFLYHRGKEGRSRREESDLEVRLCSGILLGVHTKVRNLHTVHFRNINNRRKSTEDGVFWEMGGEQRRR